MEGFEWAEANLNAESPHELQSRGVNVYFAPNIGAEMKVINLADGRVEQFWKEEDRPQTGYYLNAEDLARYCRQHGLPYSENNGQISLQPVGFEEAGDPLQHGEQES